MSQPAKLHVKSWNSILLLLGAFLFYMVYATPAFGQGVDDPAVFELEGDAQNDSPSLTFPLPNGASITAPGDDWSTTNSTGGNAKARSGLVTDEGVPTGADHIFTGGGSKDGHDLPDWKSALRNGPPDKDDLLHAYTAAYTLTNGHTAIYFGADRFDNSGDAQVGFWFFQNQVSWSAATNKFSGTHAVNDLLIVAHFTIGGAVPEIEVFRWNGSDIELVVPSNTAGCRPDLGTSDKCAITNPVTVASPWTFKDKSNSTSFLQGEFFEGALDLTALFASLPGSPAPPCISTFMAETRASAKPDSVLKDFVPPSPFPLCGIELTKECPQSSINAAGTGFVYSYRGTVTNNGIGPLYNVTVTDTPPAGSTNLNPNPAVFNLGALQPGECKQWPGGAACGTPNAPFATFESSSTQPSNSASVTSTTDPNGGANITDTASASCAAPTVSPQIDVTKECDASCLVLSNNVPRIRVNVHGNVCNIGNAQLTSVALQDDPLFATIDITWPGATGVLNPGACATYKGNYLPTALPDNTGKYHDVITATATSALGGTVTPDTAAQDCPVCPLGNCPTGP